MDHLPQGTIAQVESRQKHRLFLEAVEPASILVKITDARRLVKRGETADSWTPPNTEVITSTAVHDQHNNALPLEGNGYKRGEWDIVREFEPEFHVPADRPDYNDIDDDQRFEWVADAMAGTLTIANHLANSDLSTSVLPWIKGVTAEERRLSYRTIEQLGMGCAVFYANPYFNDGRGVLIDDLLEDLELIRDESSKYVDSADGALDIIIVGCQSPNVVSDMPDNVVASSGLWTGQNRGWRDTVTPTTQSAAEMQAIYEGVVADVERALGQPSTDTVPGPTAKDSSDTTDSPGQSSPDAVDEKQE
jgi:hypothetical protein